MPDCLQHLWQAVRLSLGQKLLGLGTQDLYSYV